MTRLRQAAALVRPSLRTTAWLPLVPAGAIALALSRLDGDALLRLRLAAIVLCVAAAFVLDDAAAATTASSPTPLLLRRLVRIALVVPLLAALWAPLVVGAAAPAGALALELAAMLALTLAASAFAVGVVSDGRGGLAGGPALLVFVAAAALALPDAWTLFASGPDDPRWAGSHLRWAALLVLGLVALLGASLDPGRARRLRPDAA